MANFLLKMAMYSYVSKLKKSYIELTRHKQAFQLMSIAATAKSDQDFSNKVEEIGFTALSDFSHGDLSKPRFCCVVVQNKINPEIVYVLNRGLSWKTLNFWGFLEEFQDILAAMRSKEPEDSHILMEVLGKIQENLEISELVVIGHSRGALVVKYNSDAIHEKFDDQYKIVRTISVDSPGNNHLEVESSSHSQYVSSFSSVINTCGKHHSQAICIKNIAAHGGKSFFLKSIESHDMGRLHDSFFKQIKVKKGRPETYTDAYKNFLAKGGEFTFIEAIAVLLGERIKEMSQESIAICDSLIVI